MMKKSLSLILALALVLGMTAFAAPSTEIYFSLDMDDYTTAESLINSFTPVTSTVSHGSFDSAGTGTFLNESRNIQDVEGATGGLYKTSTAFSTSTTSFDVNSKGNKSLLTANSSVANATQAAMVFIPKKSWNFYENNDEIYVISYDLEPNVRVGAETHFHADQTFWTNNEKSNHLSMNVFRKDAANNKLTMLANISRVFSSGGCDYSFESGKTYRVAYSYEYGAGHAWEDTTKSPSETYYVPVRSYYRDGDVWDKIENKYNSLDIKGKASDYGEGKDADGVTYASHLWNGKPVIYGFSLSWAGIFGTEYSDIIAYTVSSDPATFKAEMLDDTVEFGESAVVKFSQPIAQVTATKDAFTMTEDGNAFTAFEIGEVKTFIDEATGEVGTTVEFIFPYGQKADTTYGINLNTTGTMVKSEIMRTVASGNNLTFTTGSVPSNSVSLTAVSGLAGDGADVSTLASEQAKFTAVATASDIPSFLFVGIFDSGDNLVSYTYTKATTGDVLSLASKVEAGYTVKAFSCGSVYDLTQVFGTGADIQ